MAVSGHGTSPHVQSPPWARAEPSSTYAASWEKYEPSLRMRGCIASSSCPVAAEAPAPEPLVRAIAASGCTGRVVLVNDLVPLLWSDLLAGGGVIVNSGTGSAVIGRN